MATGTRTMWKGAITFGLVHVPVGLHTATSEQGVDFDWIDKRSMDPVGYKRINKKTGREVDREHIVKGIAVEDGQYVILSPNEVQEAYPRTTQTIEILRFVDGDAIPFVYLERPYYLAPVDRGAKVYGLLRDALAQTGKVGLAKVVIATKQHLAALIPSGPVLVLNLMRWGDQVKPLDGLDLPGENAKSTKASPSEMKMATQLINEMSGDWKPDEFKDEFREAIMKLVEKKVKAGKTEAVLEPEEEAPQRGGEVIDLADLLARSLKGGKKPAARASGAKAEQDGEGDRAEDADSGSEAGSTRRGSAKAKAGASKASSGSKAGAGAKAVAKRPASKAAAAKHPAGKRAASPAAAGHARARKAA